MTIQAVKSVLVISKKPIVQSVSALISIWGFGPRRKINPIATRRIAPATIPKVRNRPDTVLCLLLAVLLQNVHDHAIAAVKGGKHS